MTKSPLAGLCMLLCLLFCGVSVEGMQDSAAPVALVYWLKGEAALTIPSEERRPLRLFDRLPVGTTVEAGPGSRLALAFANGRRYELGERSRVTLGPADLSLRSGPVRALRSVPPLPRLLPIADEEQPGLRAGAVRIRAERITGLYPRGGAATLAGAPHLRFEPVEGGGKYGIEVHDRQGNVIFATETTASNVNVPAGLLRPDVRYHWTVRTIERVGPVAKGEADFITLPPEKAKAREALRRAVETAGDGASLVLLAEVDRSLGMLLEARDGLRAAVERSPGDARLAAGLAELERRLEEEHDVKASSASTGQAHQPLDARRIPVVSIMPAILTAPVPGNEPENGAVVEEVGKGWAADRAGLRSGDLLLSWSQGNGDGAPIRSPFALGPLEIEQAPLGTITLRGTRDGESREWILPPGRWELRARPTLPEAFLPLYEQGWTLIAAGDLETGAAHWRSAVEAADRKDDTLRAAWLQARLARELADAGRGLEADAVLEEAAQRLEGSQPAAIAQLLRDWSWSETFYFLRRNVGARAEACLRRALALEPEESLAAAWNLSFLGLIARDRGEYATAEDLDRKAYAILQKQAPGSVLAWTVQRELARVAFRRGDLASQERVLLEALEAQERLASESLDLAVILTDLGRNALARYDFFTGEERIQRALAMTERLSPDGPELAVALVSLGEMDLMLGDLARAEERFRRALDLLEELAPESFELAYYLTRLGMLAEDRGDLGAAEDYGGSLPILGKISHGAPNTSYKSVFHRWTLATVEMRKGNLSKADEYLQSVLETLDRVSPESHDIAGILFLRARIAIERDHLVLAEELLRRALAIEEKQSPGSRWISDSLETLGTVTFGRGDLPKAQELFQRALAVREKMEPGSTRMGQSLNSLGHVHRREGRLAMATERFCRATEILDQQRQKLGGTIEERSAFSGKTAEYYRDCIAALIDTGRLEEAFQVLERGRARSFLDLLGNRDLMGRIDLPPDLAGSRKQTNAEYDRTQAALDRLSLVRDQAEIDRLLVRLRALRARQEEIAAKIRQTSPRTAALHDPQPLGPAGARAALDPGTVLLAWSIGQERSFLFVVQPAGTDPGLEVFPLPLRDQDLRRSVESFRNLLQHSDSDLAALSEKARDLYDVLFRPADARIAAARRILISPDGPLHTLPFAALVRDGRWLAEQKSIHIVLSATVYAELKTSRRLESEAEPAVFAAFGDPRYPSLPPGQSSTADREVRAAVSRGLELTPLPATRDEVQGIAALYPEARTFLGTDATEERVKSIGKGARYLHFACHGLLDARFPLNSALALSIPDHPGEGQANGLLQAWEIFESMRLDADLVTLSACDSAMGSEMGGEGLLGLTRAFQYAGARSVLASLWSVADVSTADLMQRFYSHLRSGKAKDEALQSAQTELIRSADFSHPYHWAAFQLVGDWK